METTELTLYLSMYPSNHQTIYHASNQEFIQQLFPEYMCYMRMNKISPPAPQGGLPDTVVKGVHSKTSGATLHIIASCELCNV